MSVLVVGAAGFLGRAVTTRLQQRGLAWSGWSRSGKHGTRKVAEAYLQYLYSDEGQDIAGKHYYRPTGTKAAVKYAKTFAAVKLVTIDEIFGGWQKAQKNHFEDGGTFDQIYGQK